MSASKAGHDFIQSPLFPSEEICRHLGCPVRRKHPNNRSERWLYWKPGEREWRLRRLKCEAKP